MSGKSMDEQELLPIKGSKTPPAELEIESELSKVDSVTGKCWPITNDDFEEDLFQKYKKKQEQNEDNLYFGATETKSSQVQLDEAYSKDFQSQTKQNLSSSKISCSNDTQDTGITDKLKFTAAACNENSFCDEKLSVNIFENMDIRWACTQDMLEPNDVAVDPFTTLADAMNIMSWLNPQGRSDKEKSRMQSRHKSLVGRECLIVIEDMKEDFFEDAKSTAKSAKKSKTRESKAAETPKKDKMKGESKKSSISVGPVKTSKSANAMGRTDVPSSNQRNVIPKPLENTSVIKENSSTKDEHEKLEDFTENTAAPDSNFSKELEVCEQETNSISSSENCTKYNMSWTLKNGKKNKKKDQLPSLHENNSEKLPFSKGFGNQNWNSESNWNSPKNQRYNRPENYSNRNTSSNTYDDPPKWNYNRQNQTFANKYQANEGHSDKYYNNATSGGRCNERNQDYKNNHQQPEKSQDYSNYSDRSSTKDQGSKSYSDIVTGKRGFCTDANFGMGFDRASDGSKVSAEQILDQTQDKPYGESCVDKLRDKKSSGDRCFDKNQQDKAQDRTSNDRYFDKSQQTKTSNEKWPDHKCHDDKVQDKKSSGQSQVHPTIEEKEDCKKVEQNISNAESKKSDDNIQQAKVQTQLKQTQQSFSVPPVAQKQQLSISRDWSSYQDTTDLRSATTPYTGMNLTVNSAISDEKGLQLLHQYHDVINTLTGSRSNIATNFKTNYSDQRVTGLGASTYSQSQTFQANNGDPSRSNTSTSAVAQQAYANVQVNPSIYNESQTSQANNGDPSRSNTNSLVAAQHLDTQDRAASPYEILTKEMSLHSQYEAIKHEAFDKALYHQTIHLNTSQSPKFDTSIDNQTKLNEHFVGSFVGPKACPAPREGIEDCKCCVCSKSENLIPCHGCPAKLYCPMCSEYNHSPSCALWNTNNGLH